MRNVSLIEHIRLHILLPYQLCLSISCTFPRLWYSGICAEKGR